MGTLPLHTREQKIIFSEVANSEYLRKQFYFTGGTALSAFYLQHRYSDDLDFFSEQRLDNRKVLSLMESWAQKHNFTLQARLVGMVYIFQLLFPNNVPLKVDFAYYPHKRVAIGKMVERFALDSLHDIAINKIVTISQRDNVKDFVDLYYLLNYFSIWDLLYGAKEKFNMDIDPLLLASDLLKVEDFTYLPRMIKPLTLEELKVFYRQKATELGRQSFEV